MISPRIQDIVEDLINIGATFLDPVQARANDLALSNEKCEGEMALKGAVGSHLLMLAPVEKIQDEIRGS